MGTRIATVKRRRDGRPDQMHKEVHDMTIVRRSAHGKAPEA